MKYSYRIAIFVMIITLVGQGIFPGVILCRGEEGHFAVETTFDGCCSSIIDSRTCFSPSPSLYEKESATHDACGPCSDTILSAAPFRIRTHDFYSSVGPVQVAAVLPRGTDFKAKKLYASNVYTTEVELIPIKTTILLF